jgi:hypothetical protein
MVMVSFFLSRSKFRLYLESSIFGWQNVPCLAELNISKHFECVFFPTYCRIPRITNLPCGKMRTPLQVKFLFFQCCSFKISNHHNFNTKYYLTQVWFRKILNCHLNLTLASGKFQLKLRYNCSKLCSIKLMQCQWIVILEDGELDISSKPFFLEVQ